MTMNAQEIFNKVATHLFTQGVQAKDEATNKCLYLDQSTGHQCAVGCLLDKDEAIRADTFDCEGAGTGVQSILDQGLLPAELSPHIHLLSILQDIHDGKSNWEETQFMREELRECAIEHQLDYSILENLSFADR
jgi:hypothetical protein